MARDKTPADWMEDIRHGIEYREKFGSSRHWERWWRYYRNDFHEDIAPYLSVNMIFAVGRSLIPRLYFRDPSVILTPRQPGRYLQTRVLESLDNTIIREIKLKKSMKAAGLDAFLYGTGILKRGYDSEFGFNSDEGSEDMGMTVTETGEQASGERIEYDNRVIRGWPWVRRIHPSTFVVPWGTPDLDSAEWCAHRIVRRLDDVKADEKYSNTEDLQGNLTRRPSIWENDKDGKRPHRYEKVTNEYVALWEIYDAKTGKILVIAENYNKFLRKDEDEVSRGRFPFYAIRFNPDDDHFWGISDCKYLEPLQLELNETRTQAMLTRRASMLRFLYDANVISEEELNKFLHSPEPGIGIKVSNLREGSILPLQSQVPPDLSNWANDVRMDMRELTGFSRNQMGEFDRGTRRTATEAQLVQQASEIRVDERRDEMADVLVDIVEDINDMIFDLWNEEHVARIVGPDGAAHWVRFTGEQLEGDYSYRVDPDQALPVSAEIRRQEARQLLQDLMPFAESINIAEPLRHYVEQFEGLNTDALFQQPGTANPAEGPMEIGDLALQISRQMASGGGVRGA